MRFNSLSSLNTCANSNSKTPIATIIAPTTKAAAKAKATPAKTPVVAELANIKETKKYGDPTKIMKMVDKMFLTLTKFENAVDDLWMKHILTMEQAELFSVFYAKDFLKKCMKKDANGVMFMYPEFVKEIESIGDNFELIQDYLDKSLIDELLEFAAVAQEL